MSPWLVFALAAAGIAFVCLDLRSLQRTGEYENRPARALKLLSVLLLTLLVLFENKLLPRHPEVNPLPLQVAFVFTLLGDISFRVIGRFLLGVAFFAVVQLIYAWRHAYGLALTLTDLGVFVGAAMISAVVYLKMVPGMAERGLRLPVGLYIAVVGVALWAAVVQVLHGRFVEPVGTRMSPANELSKSGANVALAKRARPASCSASGISRSRLLRRSGHVSSIVRIAASRSASRPSGRSPRSRQTMAMSVVMSGDFRRSRSPALCQIETMIFSAEASSSRRAKNDRACR